MKKGFATLVFSAALVLMGNAVFAQPEPLALMQQMKEVFEPNQPTTRKVRITVQTQEEEVHWLAGQAVRQLAEGKEVLTVLLEPAGLQGNAMLVKEQADQPSVMMVYIPPLRRVREIVPVDAYEHFLGTDFTYADLGLVRLHEHYRFLGEETYQGKQAYKVEEIVPEERAYYSRIVTWIDADSKLPLKREYYDAAGKLWKIEQFDEVTTIEGVATPLQITMQDVQGKGRTQLRFEQVDYNVDLPATLFEPTHLAQAAESAVWQAYRSAAPTKK